MEFTAEKCLIQRHLHGKKSESGKECLESVIAVGKMPKSIEKYEKKLVFWKGKWKDRGIRFRQKDFACNSGGLYHECSNHRRDSEKPETKRLQRIRISQRAGVQEGATEKKETKRGCRTKGGQSLSGNGDLFIM